MLGDSTLLVLGTFGRHVVLVQGVLAGRPPLELGLLLALGCLGVVGRACMRRVPGRFVCLACSMVCAFRGFWSALLSSHVVIFSSDVVLA